jgi:hypothetical protein
MYFISVVLEKKQIYSVCLLHILNFKMDIEDYESLKVYILQFYVSFNCMGII